MESGESGSPGFAAVIITIGPCNFSTLMGFLSPSALGKVMGQPQAIEALILSPAAFGSLQIHR